MKRIITAILAGSALFLTGCATNYDGYIAAVNKQAEVENNRLMALTRIAETGDSNVKLTAALTLAFGRAAGGGVTVQPPQDKALQWASILVPGLTNLYSIQQGTRVNLANIEAETSRYGLTMGTVSGIASQGIEAAAKPPVIVGPSGANVIFPVSE